MKSRQKKKILKKVSLHKRLTWREIEYIKNNVYGNVKGTITALIKLFKNSVITVGQRSIARMYDETDRQFRDRIIAFMDEISRPKIEPVHYQWKIIDHGTNDLTNH